MKLLKGFRFSLTVILLIAVITACAAPSAQPTVEPVEGPSGNSEARVKVGDILYTPLKNEGGSANYEDIYKPANYSYRQHLQLLNLPEREEKSFRAGALEAEEKFRIVNLGNRLITTLYTIGYESESDMQKNLELAMQETYLPELLAAAQKNNFANDWAKRLFNGQVSMQIESLSDLWGKEVEMLNDDGTLIATEMQLEILFEGTSGVNMPKYFETGNETVRWGGYVYSNRSYINFRIVCKKQKKVGK